MVLVDTSVWVRGFANRAPFAQELHRLLSLNEVAGHELVYGELLIGDLSGRKAFLAAYERKPRADMLTHEEVVQLVRNNKLNGRGIGWVDAHLLASALAGGMQVWTADLALALIAEELGVAYKLPVS